MLISPPDWNIALGEIKRDQNLVGEIGDSKRERETQAGAQINLLYVRNFNMPSPKPRWN